MRLLDKFKDLLATLAEIKNSDSLIARFLSLVTTGELQVIDHRFVVAKAIGGQTLIKMTDSADSKQISISNLDRGKPAVNQFMMVTGIKFLALQAATTVDATALKNGAWGEISDVAGLQNAWVTIRSDKKNILYQLPMSAFLVGGKRSEKGYYELEFPKPILPERDLDIEIELGVAAPANSAIKCELIGPCTNV